MRSDLQNGLLKLFFCGDVMTGRGIDRILPHPSDERLYEPYVELTRQYVDIAEKAGGRIPVPADFSYIWGDALETLELENPGFRFINLETSITASPDHWESKSIHYRMNPLNIGALTAADFDCCALANNHVLDWGYAGLHETLKTLGDSFILHAGAGTSSNEAGTPAVLDAPGGGRILFYSAGASSSGIDGKWRALKNRPGVNLLRDLSHDTVNSIKKDIDKSRKHGDIVIVSLHWGSNWGYAIPGEHIRFARDLVDTAHADIIHGHSPHHPVPFETYRGKLILYGCGDFINDYEGISGHEAFRPDLVLMYFVLIDKADGRLKELKMVPMKISRFSLHHASGDDSMWLAGRLNREGKRFGAELEMKNDPYPFFILSL